MAPPRVAVCSRLGSASVRLSAPGRSASSRRQWRASRSACRAGYNAPERVEQSARVIGPHKNFVLLVRDEESRQFAEKHFDCQVKLCPDMAFAIGQLPPRPSQFPVLAMLREDAEKVGSVDRGILSDVPTEDWITESRRKVRVAKALGAASVVLSSQPDEIGLRSSTQRRTIASSVVSPRLHAAGLS